MSGNQSKNKQVGIHQTVKHNKETNEQSEKTTYKKREHICTPYI